MNKQSKVLKWTLIIGIVIVLNMFFNYVLSLVYKEPDYNVFLPQQQIVEAPTTKEDCLKVGGQWIVNPPSVKTGSSYFDNIKIPPGYCNADFLRQQEFEKMQKVYDRNVFITLVLLGALCVLIGNFLKKNMLIGIALSLAGILSFIIASMRYWSSADNLIKVIILGIALVILVWVAVKKFKDN